MTNDSINVFEPPELTSWIQTVYPGTQRIFGAQKTGVDLDGNSMTIWAGWYPSGEESVAMVDVWQSGLHIARASYDPFTEASVFSIDGNSVTCSQFIAYIVLTNAATTGNWVLPVAHPLIDAIYSGLDEDNIGELEIAN